MVVVLLGLAVAACRSSTEPQARSKAAEPARQLFLAAQPEILRGPGVAPVEPGDTQYYTVRVTARDSTFALRWWPTAILVETDRGDRRTLTLPPYACLLPEGAGREFPFTFTWWGCHQVGVNTRVALAPDRLREAERLAGGELMASYEFGPGPGAQYRFRVGTGLGVTAAAMERLKSLPEVIDAFRLDASPECLLSDIVPPPPCDPWWLLRRLPYVVDRPAGGDTLSVGRGGWVRATYTQPDGSTLSTTVAGPP
jgi:hypothetical protein